MSMRSFIISGYGFCTAKIQSDKILHFIKNHADSIENEDAKNAVKSLDWDAVFKRFTKEPDLGIDDDLTETYPELAEVLNLFVDEDISEEYLPNLYKAVADIISTETNIVMEYQGGQEDCIGSEGYIMLPESMPWNFNLKEKALNENSFKELLAKYTDELGLEKSEIGSCEVEYFG